MISKETLAGYILEEVLARLIQTSGYRLLTNRNQDPCELDTNRAGDLLVKGRGGTHQVDVLGEFSIVPAFSYPLRLFVEAKARKAACGIPVVRNAVGTLTDVNEAWMLNYSTNRARRHYRYALFSTGGFTRPAQNYAIAHQIGLIDLSGPEWDFLTTSVLAAAEDLLESVPRGWRGPFPVRSLRTILRSRFDTAPDVSVIEYDIGEWEEQMSVSAERLMESIFVPIDGALLAFPAGQQVLLARPENLREFLTRGNREPEHQVTLTLVRRQVRGSGATWLIRPSTDEGGSYSLQVTLPAAIEERILAESDRRTQIQIAKGELGGRLDIFWDPKNSPYGALLSGPRLFRLAFAPVELRRR